MDTIEIMPEILEQIRPPEEFVRPVVLIDIFEDDSGSDDDDIVFIETIDITTNPETTVIPTLPTRIGDTPRFVVFEDEPVILRRVMPVYPEGLRRTRTQGQVVLTIEVFADGSIGAIEVVRSLLPGPGGFDEAAINAVRQWQFQPATSGGQPVACWVRQIITFDLTN